MTPFLAAMVLSTSVFAQPKPNGDPSPTVQQEQKQADYAAKGQPRSGKPKKEQPTSLRTKEMPAKSPKSKPGESALRTPSK